MRVLFEIAVVAIAFALGQHFPKETTRERECAAISNHIVGKSPKVNTIPEGAKAEDVRFLREKFWKIEYDEVYFNCLAGGVVR